MSDKPREWWIPNENFISKGPHPVEGDGTHITLVEKSAYDALKAELLELKEMMPRMADSIPWANSLQRQAAQKEIDALKAEVERLKELNDANVDIWQTVLANSHEWQAQAEKLAEVLDRQTHPHIESFCKERAKNALAEFAKFKEEMK